jgi:hypothetical protein
MRAVLLRSSFVRKAAFTRASTSQLFNFTISRLPEQPFVTLQRLCNHHDSFEMGDVVVENPANQVLPHRKQLPSSIPNIDTLEGLGTDGSDEYSTLKKLQRHLE